MWAPKCYGTACDTKSATEDAISQDADPTRRTFQRTTVTGKRCSARVMERPLHRLDKAAQPLCPDIDRSPISTIASDSAASRKGLSPPAGHELHEMPARLWI